MSGRRGRRKSRDYIVLDSNKNRKENLQNTRPLTFELESFQNLQVVPLFFFLALDPVEHERAQAQVAHENDETHEPSANHNIIVFRSDRGATTQLKLLQRP